MNQFKLIAFKIYFLLLSIYSYSQSYFHDSSSNKIILQNPPSMGNTPFQLTIPFNGTVNLNNSKREGELPLVYTVNGYLPDIGANYEINVWVNEFTDVEDVDDINHNLSKWIKWKRGLVFNNSITELQRKIEQKSGLYLMSLDLQYQAMNNSFLKYIDANIFGALNRKYIVFVQFESFYITKEKRDAQATKFHNHASSLYKALSLTELTNNDLSQIKIGTVNQEGVKDEGSIVAPPTFYDTTSGITKKNIVVSPVHHVAKDYSISKTKFNSQSFSKRNLDFKTVKLGDKVWMAENLSTVMFSNGDSIQYVPAGKQWRLAMENKIPAWCYYNNDPSTEPMLGRMYNWYAINDSRGIAPVGWRVPTDEDFLALCLFLGGIKVDIQSLPDESRESVFYGIGKTLKKRGYWVEDLSKYNLSGFDAVPLFSGGLLPGGYRLNEPTASWWTLSAKGSIDAWYYSIDGNDFSRVLYDKGMGHSVRLIKE